MSGHERYLRLFNRLEKAVSDHAHAEEKRLFADDADEKLWAAYRAVMKQATSGEGDD